MRGSFFNSCKPFMSLLFSILLFFNLIPLWTKRTEPKRADTAPESVRSRVGGCAMHALIGRDSICFNSVRKPRPAAAGKKRLVSFPFMHV